MDKSEGNNNLGQNPQAGGVASSSAPTQQQAGVTFNSANIPAQQNPFATQNQQQKPSKSKKTKAKKNGATNTEKQGWRLALIIGGIVIGVLLAWLIIFCIVKLVSGSDITAISDDEYGTPIGVLEAEKILEENNDDMSKVQEYFNQKINSESNISKKNDIALMAMEFYDYNFEDEMIVSTSELVDPATMDQWQLANYTARLSNFYGNMGDHEKSEYWDQYYDERYTSDEYGEESEEASGVNDEIETEGED